MQISDQGPVRWMRDLLNEWLQTPGADPGLLVRWLQGYDLPPVGSDDEPYLWLLRGLPLARGRREAERELARRLARLLDGRPDEAGLGEASEKALFNLLKLCAGLSCADELADPLYAMYERRRLTGQWRGIDLRDALLGALVTNQTDARLEPVWQAMLRGEPDGFLGGDEDDGFDGIVAMPPTRTTRGQPALDAIGRALGSMAKLLHDESDRCRQFQRLVMRVQETYPGRPNWDYDLIVMADTYGWPDWACESISLFALEPGEHPDGSRGFMLRKVAVDLIADDARRGGGEFCQGKVVRVTVSGARAAQVAKLASSVEEARLGSPWQSESSLLGIANDVIAKFERSIGRDTETVKQSEARRVRVLRERRRSLGAQMIHGRVRWFNKSKGFGLITREDGEDVYVQISAVETEGFTNLSEGDRVEFEVMRGPSGLQAKNVRRLRSP